MTRKPREYSPNEATVGAHLHLGEKSAITIRELRTMIRLKPRSIKRAVRGLRVRHNVPVCSNRTGPWPGYFIAETPQEITKTYRMLRSEGIANLEAALSLPGRRNERLRRMLGQLELELMR